MKEIYRVAIDGPSGAGKSSIAKLVAKEFGIDYIDTGAMYRAVGLKMVRNGIPMVEDDTLKKMLSETDVDFNDGHVFLDGEDVSGLIRTEEISKAASDCSAFASVRRKLVELQQAMAERKSVIMDGRDICTVVLKNAEIKLFMTASQEERAKRRFKELAEKGQDVSFEKVLEDIEKRDYNDSHRDVDPLRQAEDAELLDTTNMSVEDVVKAIGDRIRSL